MPPSAAFSLHRTRIRNIALSHHMSGVRVFGSALRGDDVAGSNLDLLSLQVDALAPTGLPPAFACRYCPTLCLYEPSTPAAYCRHGSGRLCQTTSDWA